MSSRLTLELSEAEAKGLAYSISIAIVDGNGRAPRLGTNLRRQPMFGKQSLLVIPIEDQSHKSPLRTRLLFLQERFHTNKWRAIF